MTTTYKGCVSITDQVLDFVEKSGVQEGFAVVSLPHSTAGLAITSFWDERGLQDLMDEIDRNVPARVTYKHQTSPFDAAGHVKNAIMGGYATLIIHKGKLVLGSSQGLVLVEYDGPREREYYLQIVNTGNLHCEVKKLTTVYAGMHDITEDVKQTVASSGVNNGICHVSMLHSTAGLVIGPKDRAAQKDVMGDIENMVPTRGDFKHRETASDAGGHVKTALIGSQISLIVEDGKLQLGDEQALVFTEFDGPRPRSFTIGVYEA